MTAWNVEHMFIGIGINHAVDSLVKPRVYATAHCDVDGLSRVLQ